MSKYIHVYMFVYIYIYIYIHMSPPARAASTISPRALNY